MSPHIRLPVSHYFDFPISQSFYLDDAEDIVYRYIIVNDNTKEVIFIAAHNVNEDQMYFTFDEADRKKITPLADHYCAELLRHDALLFAMQFVKDVTKGDYVAPTACEHGLHLCTSKVEFLENHFYRYR